MRNGTHFSFSCFCFFYLQILDEKSLIKKYQKEIITLKEELEHLKQGMIDKNHANVSSDGQQKDIIILRKQVCL